MDINGISILHRLKSFQGIGLRLNISKRIIEANNENMDS